MFGNNSNFGGSNFSNFGSLDSGFGSNGIDSSIGQPSLIQQTYNFGLPQASLDQAMGGTSTTIAVRKLYLGQTRPQHNQHRRSYDVMLDGQGLNAIQEEVDRYGQKAFDPSNIGNLMAKGADFLRHSGQAEAAVNIDNGWDTERFRFTMVVDVYRNGQFNRTEFISGYTDSAAVLNAGLISTVSVDPQMVFTINHITEARLRQMDANGQPIAMVSRANAVVRNNDYVGLGLSNNTYLTRPSDILRAVDKVELYRGMSSANNLGETAGMGYADLDSLLTNVPMMANDTNMLIPTFASRTLSGLYQNSLQQFDPMNMDNTSAGSLASQRVQDTSFTSSGFVHVLNRRQATGTSTTAQFTFGELLLLDPTIDDRTEVFGKSYESGAISIPDGRSVAMLGAAETIAVHATSVAQATLSLMSLAGVATLAYNANNMTTGMTEVTLQACDGMDQDGQLANRLEVLKSRLIVECLNMLCAHQETYEVDVFADAFNDVFIQIFHDGVRRDYVIPAFASSSLAPVITQDMSRLVGIAEGIAEVVDTCKQLINPGSHNQDSIRMAVQGDGNTRIGGLAGDY